MSSSHKYSKKADESDDDDEDDFFSNGTSPARTQTRVISKRRQSPENSEDDQIVRSIGKVAVSPRHDKSKMSPRSVSVSPYTASSQRTSVRSPYSTDTSLADLHSSVRKSHSMYGNIRKSTGLRGSQKGKKMKQIAPNSRNASVAKLMLSAKQQEINDLLSKLSHTKQKLASAEKENKLLKKLQNRQDKAIRKFEDTKNDLPRLLSKTSEDQRTLKFELRRSQETKRSLEAKLHQNYEEMQKMEGILMRLKKLVYDKSLGESSELSTQLADAETRLQVAKNEIKDLNKKIELRVTKFSKQLNMERQKHRDTLNKLQKVHERYTETDTKLKERERAVNVSNIYSMRKKISPEKVSLPICPMIPIVDPPKLVEPKPVSGSTKQAEDQNEMNKQENPRDSFSNTSPSLNRLHSDVSGAKPQSERKSVFLTADVDSLRTSPSNSFLEEPRNSSSRCRSARRIQKQKVVEEQTDFADDLKKTEQEIKKLQIAVRQKADLLAKLQQIDENESNKLDIPKSTSPTFSSLNPAFNLKSNSKMSFSNSDITSSPYFETQQQADVQPLKPAREISFGGYAPTVAGLARRKSPVVKKPVVVTNQSAEVDEPLFDLSSGKKNKKSDLLAQLFGSQEGVKSAAVV